MPTRPNRPPAPDRHCDDAAFGRFPALEKKASLRLLCPDRKAPEHRLAQAAALLPAHPLERLP